MWFLQKVVGVPLLAWSHSSGRHFMNTSKSNWNHTRVLLITDFEGSSNSYQQAGAPIACSACWIYYIIRDCGDTSWKESLLITRQNVTFSTILYLKEQIYNKNEQWDITNKGNLVSFYSEKNRYGHHRALNVGK